MKAHQTEPTSESTSGNGQSNSAGEKSALPSPLSYPVQTKLTIGEPGDKFEREADAMADHAIQKLYSGNSDDTPPEIQPMKADEAPIRASAEGKTTLPPGFQDQLQAEKGSGKALPGQNKGQMEAVFGADFSNVKIHHGAHAANMNQQIGARAFTNGQDIYFNNGQYNPNSVEGNRLLAHELTHVVQQGVSEVAPKIQCEWAVAPTVAEPTFEQLTARQIRIAQRLNSVLFTDANEIGEIRDVLGISREPSVVDQDFIEAVGRYQAYYGLSQDGILGPDTSGVLAREIAAEADFLGDARRGTLRRTVARRLLLRSRVERRSGRIQHQGFTGPEDNPGGVITARTGGDETSLNALLTRSITLDYTGRDADNTHWLQFVSPTMYGVQPGGTRTYNTGISGSFAGFNILWSTNTTTNWSVDSLSAASPFYDTAGAGARRAGRSVMIADQPQGWLPTANSFAATLTPTPTRVRMIMRFISYAVVNNRPRYFVEWFASYNFTPASGGTPGTQSNVVYWIGRTGTTSRLRTAHRTAVDTRNPGNGIL